MKMIDQSTAQITVEADQPDQPAYNDLAYLSFYYRVNDGPTVVGAKLPAISPDGGDHYRTDLIVPAPVNATTSIQAWATATDVAGNESPASTPFLLTVERLAPPVPVNFTVS